MKSDLDSKSIQSCLIFRVSKEIENKRMKKYRIEGETNGKRLTIASSVFVWVTNLSNCAINPFLYSIIFE